MIVFLAKTVPGSTLAQARFRYNATKAGLAEDFLTIFLNCSSGKCQGYSGLTKASPATIGA
jgi:hypothetical protein